MYLRCGCVGRPLSQITADDFDVAVVGQLPATNLPLGKEFEPGPAKVVGFDAPLGCRGLIEQGLEYAPADAHDAFIFADADPELDCGAIGVPTGIWGKPEEHCDLLPVQAIMFRYCSQGRAMSVPQGERIPGGFILIKGMDGIRYAVRPQSVGIIHDADECQDETLIQLHGGHVVRVPATLDEVLTWFC